MTESERNIVLLTAMSLQRLIQRLGRNDQDIISGLNDAISAEHKERAASLAAEVTATAKEPTTT